jgi:hypothetical protein
MKLLTVRDHFVVPEGLRRCCIRQAASTRDALIAFQEDRSDRVLLDLNLPNSLI